MKVTDRTDREAYARYAREHRGDPIRGHALFFDLKGAPARCHRAGAGGDIAPDLSDVGGKYERTLLIESVLEPSRQIVEGYRPTIVATAEGRVLSGIVKGDSPEELALVNADGHRQVIRKSVPTVRPSYVNFALWQEFIRYPKAYLLWGTTSSLYRLMQKKTY